MSVEHCLCDISNLQILSKQSQMLGMLNKLSCLHRKSVEDSVNFEDERYCLKNLGKLRYDLYIIRIRLYYSTKCIRK